MPLIATRGAASVQGFGEFAQSAVPNYIEDVFSTYLYTGNDSTQTITNGIDLSTKGGLVWMKSRTDVASHALYDTVRGATQELESQSTNAQTTRATGLTAFNSTGFSIGSRATINSISQNYVSWTFREQPKFFDIVTYTGDGTGSRAIPHNLGSVPGCIIVKSISLGLGWPVYHRGMDVTNPEFYEMFLNTTAAKSGAIGVWGTAPTSTNFYVTNAASVNQGGDTYVAYLFAHDAGGFGLTGTDNVISCGSFTTDGSGNASVSLGYEPQWIMTKAVSTAGSWYVMDNMRGLVVQPAGSTLTARLLPNGSNAEVFDQDVSPNATGFTGGYNSFGASQTYIYIAIRRGPMKVPTDATKVFVPYLYAGLTNPDLRASFPVDFFFLKRTTPSEDWFVGDRLRGDYYLATNTTGAEAATGGYFEFDYQNGAVNGFGLTTAYVSHLFRRAPSFFDEVCYTGNATIRTINHNLGVVPELMIIKKRSSTASWPVYLSPTTLAYLDLTDARYTGVSQWNSTAPTSTVFTIATSNEVNENAQTYVAYLFATCAGVSKVGSYTGTGAAQTINCGFTAGSRFVMIKRTDSTGDWYVWDSARGIIPANDPYLLFNSSAAQTTGTDYVDTTSVGFDITSTAPAAINANGGTFVFLAIA
jgi:hypothetical protein